MASEAYNDYKYPHKDKPSIDMVSKETLEQMKTFKGAKMTNTEWLTKRKPVRQATDPEFKGKGA